MKYNIYIKYMKYNICQPNMVINRVPGHVVKIYIKIIYNNKYIWGCIYI